MPPLRGGGRQDRAGYNKRDVTPTRGLGLNDDRQLLGSTNENLDALLYILVRDCSLSYLLFPPNRYDSKRISTYSS